ncbi:hypothetical protein Glove_81g21 [Diversispora epigaea]|uniref:Uncharacterized protein n=1 Tax=Diversispora epigaea TaxID=1348612 RepID=A0A397JAB8_9GLOM|nr:hypothetical protein Glove_81g21 [Diversispora epigaea]
MWIGPFITGTSSALSSNLTTSSFAAKLLLPILDNSTASFKAKNSYSMQYGFFYSAWRRIHQIYESLHPKNRNGFLDSIVSVFLKRKVVGLTTVCLIVQLAFEGPLLSILFKADCAGSRMNECRDKIMHELESHEFSNNAPSYVAMALAVIALSGIVDYLLEGGIR